MAEYAIDPKTGRVVVVDNRKGQARDGSTGTTSTDTTAPPASVLTAQQQADARNSIASGGRSITGQQMGNFLRRDSLRRQMSREEQVRHYTRNLSEAKWRDLYARRSTLTPGSMEYMQLLFGANIYNPRAKGTPEYRGTHDTLPGSSIPATEVFAMQNPGAESNKANGQQYSQSVQDLAARYGITLPGQQAASGTDASSTTAARAEPFATTQNPAGPANSAAQASQGQQGATTNTTSQTQAQQQNQETQFRSSRTGFSGNRRFHPFGG